jgi:signal transduction histidine kinase/CheY-like chemotaxis protein
MNKIYDSINMTSAGQSNHNNSFTGRLFVTVVVTLSLCIVAVFSWLNIKNLEKHELNQIADLLQGELTISNEILSVWAEQNFKKINSLSVNPRLSSITENLLALPRTQDNLVQSGILTQVRHHLAKETADLEQRGFFIIAPDGISIASRRDANIGTKNLIAMQRNDLFMRVLQGETVLIPPIVSDVPLTNTKGKLVVAQSTMFFLAPIKNSADKVIAALSIRLDPDKSFTRYTRMSRFGNTGETYAIDKNGLMISSSRFDKQLREIGLIENSQKSALNVYVRDPGGNLFEGHPMPANMNTQPYTLMAASIISEIDGVNVEGYRDYRGIYVMGAWLWNDKLGIGLVAEVDRDEAILIVQEMRFSILLVFIITVLVVIVLAGFFVWMGQVNKRVLKKAYDSLEHKVEERTKELNESKDQMNQAKKEAEKATKYKSEFLANMSHEIRTPMNAVIGLSYLMQSTELDLKQQDYLNKISRSAHNLLGIINDILDFSKIEAGKLDLEHIDFDLAETLDNFATVVAVKSAEKGLELLIQMDDDLPLQLNGDPLRLNQILINLVNNAVKFTSEGEIVISIRLVEKNNESLVLRFAISDTGIGMSQKQVANLFQAFSQADGSISRKFGGTGLGLTISKRFVEMMKGEIGVESEINKGSTFFFTARFGLGKTHKKILKQIIPENLAHLSVLVVDDNPTSRLILTQYLESFGFNVEECASGAEALHKIKQESPSYQLVLMDWKMPTMNGIEASLKIQQLQLDEIPKILMVSAFTKDEIRQKAKAAGIGGYLVKPINPSILFNEILAMFGHEVLQQTVQTRHQAMEHIRGANILLVEDNEINQQIADELLSREQINVTIADNGKIALEILDSEEFNFDAVLMDIQMPVMDGYTATQKIRQRSQFDKLPIIAMTANAMSSDRERAIKEGMNDHIAKPIDVKQLFDILGQWINIPEDKRPIVKEDRADNASKPDISKIESLVNLPGIDVKAGLRRVNNDSALYLKIAGKFINSQANFIERLNSAWQVNDITTAEREIHTLKGISGNLGAADLQEQATVVELQIIRGELKNDSVQTLGLLLNDVISLLQTLTNAQESLAVPNNATSIEKNSKQITKLMHELRQLLEDDDGEATDIVDELLAIVGGSEKELLLKKLATLVDEYEFDDALTLLSEIEN